MTHPLIAPSSTTQEKLSGRLDRWKSVIAAIVLHALASIGTSFIALWLRYDGVPHTQWTLWLRILPWLIGIRILAFVTFRLHQRLWRYASVWDLRNIFAAVAVGSLTFYALTRFWLDAAGHSPSILIVDSILLICATGTLYLMSRLSRAVLPTKAGKRVLIVGAGDAGELIVRDMKNNDYYNYRPIGFVDDDRGKVGRRIHGVPVLGTRHDLPEVLAHHRPDEVLIAIPSAPPAVIRGMVRALEPFRIPITTLPNLRDIVECRVFVNQIRKLSVEDLLVRAVVDLPDEPLCTLLGGRRVLVTGAGGSIGSELARQLLKFHPASLVLVERYENSLHSVATELTDRSLAVAPLIADITDDARINRLLAEYRPDLVFHAAAHKHVPLMEANPSEAVKNNVRGTRVLIEACSRNGVSRLVLISSDKAVRSSSVMGATKRVAELLMQSRHGHTSTELLTVRFGNVLGSNGSVVPRFIEQIAAGGPVTVTHPEMRRYFMLIPEAAQLVLHAGVRGSGGHLYVLDMGEQLRVLDMARDLIRLSGYVPEDEIPIRFIGVRPGEKLYEELTGPDETLEPSTITKVMRVRSLHTISSVKTEELVRALEAAAALEDDERVVQLLPLERSSRDPAAGSAAAIAAVGDSIGRGAELTQHAQPRSLGEDSAAVR